MAISRYRKRGPTVHNNHKIGEQWIHIWGWTLKAADVYCLGGNSYNPQTIRLKECFDETHPGPPWRSGGPLWIKEWESPPLCVCTDNAAAHYISPDYMQDYYFSYLGKFAHNYAPGIPDTSYYEAARDDDLGVTYGAKAWNRFRPTRSKADLGQFLAELRDFKSLFATRLRSFKELGSAYLNLQFGWTPFLKDIVKFFNAMKKVDKTIDFIRKNNNKWILRGGTVHRDREVGEVQVVPTRIYPILDYPFHRSAPVETLTTRITPIITERVWFKARMKYYIPNLSTDKADNIFTSRLLRMIYGLEMTPSLLWELTPWSWLVDWFGNVGDIVANLSSKYMENLVAKYAYIMRTWEKRTEYYSEMPLDLRNGSKTIKLTSHTKCTTKQRIEASPFGFHLDMADLSAYQLSILTALGFDRRLNRR